MFKEVKKISSNQSQINDQLALRKIAEAAKVDRTETCFRGSSRQTRKEYAESMERIRVLSKKYHY